jgi:hypothetical protein
MEIVHKLGINCGMMLGAWIIRLMSENPAAVPIEISLPFFGEFPYEMLM